MRQFGTKNGRQKRGNGINKMTSTKRNQQKEIDEIKLTKSKRQNEFEKMKLTNRRKYSLF